MFAAVWLIFIVYPVVAVITSDSSAAVKAIGLALLALFVVVYLLLCVYSMFDEDGSVALRNTAIAALAALMVGLMPILHTDAFAVAPFLMAAVSFAAPWKPRYSLAAVVAIIAAAVVVPEIVGWELDTGFLIVMVVVGITMGFSRVMRDSQREREEATERQRELNARLAVVAERERVARDVHDILGHSLTVISVKSELAGRLVDLDPDRAKTELAELNALAREALAEVRATVGNLRAPELPSVVAAAEIALTTAGIDADLPDPDSCDGVHAELFAWVLREAVTNVVRHSGATRCTVTLTAESISIADNGRGSPLLTFGNGLRGLAERVDAGGGRLVVDSDATGTTVTATVGLGPE
ncbi:signal transduction histidine kinase [Gordonia neofelifaecis NRRL B-59395]|uniref:Signal transduction histidine kinase n=1 Tax=Gordonia neofelifaecis NRRL B-59395 TaxID=644548 RepID=F1YP75_9ACTN|nr:signal transduction histidine kinase [Gordonia neofelifaecis NRRL B-59395]